MHNCQPNLTAARILTSVIKWLNCKGCESEFSHHDSNDMEHLSLWQLCVFCLKILSIYIKQHLM
jgi:hypothetical protein